MFTYITVVMLKSIQCNDCPPLGKSFETEKKERERGGERKRDGSGRVGEGKESHNTEIIILYL